MKNLKKYVMSFVGVGSVLCTSLLFAPKIKPEEILAFSTPINKSQLQSTVFLVNNSQQELNIQVVPWKVGLFGPGPKNFNVELGPQNTSGNAERLSFAGGVKGFKVKVPYGKITDIEIFGESNKKVSMVWPEEEPKKNGEAGIYAPAGSILEFRIEDAKAKETETTE
jgi:hypothetical protein